MFLSLLTAEEKTEEIWKRPTQIESANRSLEIILKMENDKSLFDIDSKQRQIMLELLFALKIIHFSTCVISFKMKIITWKLEFGFSLIMSII